jgi:hypothetical protein
MKKTILVVDNAKLLESTKALCEEKRGLNFIYASTIKEARSMLDECDGLIVTTAVPFDENDVWPQGWKVDNSQEIGLLLEANAGLLALEAASKNKSNILIRTGLLMGNYPSQRILDYKSVTTDEFDNFLKKFPYENSNLSGADKLRELLVNFADKKLLDVDIAKSIKSLINDYGMSIYYGSRKLGEFDSSRKTGYERVLDHMNSMTIPIMREISEKRTEIKPFKMQ